MAYDLKCWPDSVSRKEINDLPTGARAEVKVALRELQRFGPSPPARTVKNLGKAKDGLWQLNLKVNREQIRLLYFPWGGRIIVVLSVFKKTSKLQQREYETAMQRKKEAERRLGNDDDGRGLAALD